MGANITGISIMESPINSTIITSFKGVTDISLDISTTNSTIITRFKGVTDLSVMQISYWETRKRYSHSVQK